MTKKFSFSLLLILIAFFSSISLGDELTVDPPKIWEADCIPCRPRAICPPPPIEEGITIDLKDPLYEEGMLSTDQGGIVRGPHIRIQARQILYIQNASSHYVFCSGDLLIDYKDKVLVGDALFYDFKEKNGIITNGRTAYPPWYLGGTTITLLENGHLLIHEAYLTTSEGKKKEILILSQDIEVTRDRIIMADNIQFRIGQVPVFWFPKIQYDLKSVGQSPFAVKFGWGGFLGSHLSLRYHFLSWNELEGFARIDGFFPHGFGGGIETVYNPKFSCTELYTRNYYAHDIAIDDPKRRDRYRLQGTYYDRLFGCISVNGMYDIVSDGQMAADYQTKDFELKTAGRTQIDFRCQQEHWISNLFARARVNSFQTVNQELPSWEVHWHPFEIGNTGMIAENFMKASYLDYEFSDEIANRPNFSSVRFAVRPSLYRPIHFGTWIATPEAGFIGIAYSDSPSGEAVGQAVGKFGLQLETSFHKYYRRTKHVVEPYARYTYLTSPRVGLDDYYVFTIQDGYAKLNQLRFGVRNALFTQCGWRTFWIDLWANAFFDSETIPQIIPKAYLHMEWMPHQRLLVNMMGAWNFEHQLLDFYNGRIEWTLSEHFAFGTEYRHRSQYDWRKADFYNFILEAARPESILLDSILSDKRDTVLARFFYRYNPNWTGRFSFRYGWNRPDEKSYLEYLIEVGTVLFSNWNLNFIYENREADNRYSLSFKLKPGPPSRKKAFNCF